MFIIFIFWTDQSVTICTYTERKNCQIDFFFLLNAYFFRVYIQQHWSLARIIYGAWLRLRLTWTEYVFEMHSHTLVAIVVYSASYVLYWRIRKQSQQRQNKHAAVQRQFVIVAVPLQTQKMCIRLLFNILKVNWWFTSA